MFLDCKPSDIRWASQHLPELEELMMEIHPIRFQKGFKRTIRFKKVKQLKIRFYDKRDELEGFPLVFDQLEELDLRCYWLTDDRVEFAHRNKLKKLTLFSEYEEGLELTEIISRWPNLEEVSLQIDGVDDAVFLMEGLIHLKKIEMHGSSKKNIAEFTSKIGKEWKVEESTIDCEQVTITKA